jgi:hypothetical protein
MLHSTEVPRSNYCEDFASPSDLLNPTGEEDVSLVYQDRAGCGGDLTGLFHQVAE